jgi:hypothetical protein
LREIAQGTGAEFFSANSIQGIKDIYKAKSAKILNANLSVLRCLIKSTKIFLTIPNLLLFRIDPEASKINEIS